jgi:N utilization substance protein A
MAAGINLIGFIKEIGDKKKISYDVVAQNFKEALLKTHEKLYPEAILDVVIDVDKGKFTMAEKFEIIADDIEEYDDYIQMPLAEAKRIDAAAKIGGTLLIPFKPNTTYLNEILKNFKHNNTSEQNKYIYNNSKDKVGQVLYLRVESYSHDLATVELDDTFVTVDKEELIPGEKLQVGSKYYFYVKKVDEKLKSNPVILSRSDSNLVLYLLKKEIPEIEDGVIVIKKIARVAGERTKIAVTCNDNNIDPIGTIIGPKGNRINRVKDAINKERIEIIR